MIMEPITIDRQEYTELIMWALEAHRKIEVLAMVTPDRAVREQLTPFTREEIPDWFKPHAEAFTSKHLI